MLSKPLRDLVSGDILRFVTDAPQEDDQLEFKQALPNRGDGTPDPWMSAGGGIGNRARDELLAEVVAFANAHGGTLLLGIAESGDKPARAERLTPLPRCHELAERLRLQGRDCIEPQIPLLDAVGVEMEDGGSGVVVVRVPRSRVAPHRLSTTRECYIRRADRCEKMTMLEIQDLTLQVERGQAAIHSVFETKRREFQAWLPMWLGSQGAGVAIRACAVPLDRIFLDDVHRNPALKDPCREFEARLGGVTVPIIFPFTPGNSTPILRGTRRHKEGPQARVGLTIWADGCVEYSLVHRVTDQSNLLYPGWVIGLFANSLLTTEQFRSAAGGAGIEYGIEFDIDVKSRRVLVGSYNGRDGDAHGEIDVGLLRFPRYSVGPKEQFCALVGRFERDFWNAAGQDVERDFQIVI